MTFKDCLLAKYVEVRLDTYELHSVRYIVEYRPWAWICKLAGGATEECVDVADEGDRIMDEASRLTKQSGNVRAHAWHLLEQRGIVHSAKARQYGNENCESCEHGESCTIRIDHQRVQAWIEEQLKGEDNGLVIVSGDG